MKPLLAELRDWTAFALSGVGLYLSWRWRPRQERRDPDALTPTPALLNLSPAHGTSSASLALTTGNDFGTRAVLDQMAEVFPHEFPPN